jgi:CHRD domain
MRKRIGLIAVLAITGAVAVGTVAAVAVADEGSGVRESLTGYEEVPALSTPGVGQFRATIDRRDNEIDYRLSFQGTETNVTQAHIHFENATNNGPITVFLCTNLGNGHPGTQACPATGGTITGTIVPAHVSAAAASAQAVAAGLGVGEFDELVRAIRAGATYVNVHTTGRPGGEIRAQLAKGGDDDD